MTNSNYIQEYLPSFVIEKLQSGAFQSLCQHLQERSDQVQNIDLMTVSGFCRNCLAKWMVIEARKLADTLQTETPQQQEQDQLNSIIQSLNAMGYDEAAEYVYGMDYNTWKKAHSKKASDDQMQKFNDSQPMWAVMDKTLLAKRSDVPGPKQSTTPTMTTTTTTTTTASSPSASTSLLSNVCCQNVEEIATPQPKTTTTTTTTTNSKTRELPPFQPPAPPSTLTSFSLGILTISDRASSGDYETGDLSGPAVLDAVQRELALLSKTKNINSSGSISLASPPHTAIVPDDLDAIVSKLTEWSSSPSSSSSSSSSLDLIFTTGGTGFASRDVTPEATKQVIDYECSGLVTFCTMECSKVQPLSSLSRGTAGIKNSTLIINLPGNPKGVNEIIPIILPLAFHAIADLKQQPQ